MKSGWIIKTKFLDCSSIWSYKLTLLCSNHCLYLKYILPCTTAPTHRQTSKHFGLCLKFCITDLVLECALVGTVVDILFVGSVLKTCGQVKILKVFSLSTFAGLRCVPVCAPLRLLPSCIAALATKYNYVCDRSGAVHNATLWWKFV